MTKKIFKYEVEIKENCKIDLPKGAEILTVQAQRERCYIWAMVDPNEKKTEQRTFETFGTGQNISCTRHDKRKHIGTYQLSGGALVFHLFERL